jgi:hypothetical protein
VTTALGFNPLGASIAASTLLGNPTSSSATPTTITLANGLIFSGGALSLGSITVTGLTDSGNASITGTLAAGATTITGTLSASGAVTFSTTLGVTGNLTTSNIQATGGSLIVGASTSGSTAAAYNSSGQMASVSSGTVGTYYTIWNSGNFTPGNYLPLTGGTLTGALAGTSATFSSTLGITGALSGSSATFSSTLGVSGAMTAAAASFSGITTFSQYSKGQVFIATASPPSASIYNSQQGAYFGWNYNGAGETDFWNNEGGGTGGWQWFNTNSTGGSITQAAVLSATGNFTTYGTTVNFNASDRDVKTNFKARDPRSIHHLWYGDYDRIDIEAHGIGRIAQDVQTIMPHHVYEDRQRKIPGTDRPLLVIDRVGVLEESGVWAGLQIDQIWNVLRSSGLVS